MTGAGPGGSQPVIPAAEADAFLDAYRAIRDALQGRGTDLQPGDGHRHLVAVCNALRHAATTEMLALARIAYQADTEEARAVLLRGIEERLVWCTLAALDNGRVPPPGIPRP